MWMKSFAHIHQKMIKQLAEYKVNMRNWYIILLLAYGVLYLLIVSHYMSRLS